MLSTRIYRQKVSGKKFTSSVSVHIDQIAFDEGIGPFVSNVQYEKPVERRAVMIAIRNALLEWYFDMAHTNIVTVKVRITGRPAEWIGDGKIPTVRLA